MAAITLRLPDPLQIQLRHAAAANHRSINKQALVLIEQALSSAAPAPPPQDASQAMLIALMAIVDTARQQPLLLDTRSENEILGYDDHGIPA
jgi:plasmid stability protein